LTPLAAEVSMMVSDSAQIGDHRLAYGG
jgi:hypothetical protein